MRGVEKQIQGQGSAREQPFEKYQVVNVLGYTALERVQVAGNVSFEKYQVLNVLGYTALERVQVAGNVCLCVLIYICLQK